MKAIDRRAAQDALLHAATAAVLQVQEAGDMTPELEAAMRQQLRRMERLFGYDTGSWNFQ